MPQLTISLLTYNSEHYLPHCLGSIIRQTFQDVELVCRDNQSQDRSAEVIRSIVPSARLVISQRNDGFSRGHNETIRTTDSEYVCIINPDCMLDQSYLSTCVAYLDAHPRAGSVGGLLMRVPSLTDNPTSDIIDSSGLTIHRTLQAENAHAGRPSSACRETSRVIGLPATAVIYRRSALEDIAIRICKRQCADCTCPREYFDEDFFMYKEDVDLALRLSLRGWETYMLLQTRGYHIRSTDPRTFVRPSQWINRISYRNHWYILIKDVSRRLWMRTGLRIVLYECTKFFYLLFREPRTLGALRDVMIAFPHMQKKRRIIMNRATTDIWPLISR